MIWYVINKEYSLKMRGILKTKFYCDLSTNNLLLSKFTKQREIYFNLFKIQQVVYVLERSVSPKFFTIESLNLRHFFYSLFTMYLTFQLYITQ